MDKPRLLPISEALEGALQAAFDSGVTDARRVTGGDVSEAFEVRFGSGKRAFVKTHPSAPPGMYDAEAHGLGWLRAADPERSGRAPRIPEVLAVSTPESAAPFLALEWIAPRPRVADWDERFAHALAALHRAGAPGFGLDRPNFIGRLPQDNTPAETWSEFYVTRRLEPQLRRAVDGKNASLTMKSGFARLFARMESRVEDPEPPARLHGDLWSGNVMADDAGEPCLVDPAVYGGSREVDLAMMRLFGGFSEAVFRAYDEVFPLGEGHEDRVPLYQLYPLLVHLNLFGHGYGDQVEAALRRVR